MAAQVKLKRLPIAVIAGDNLALLKSCGRGGLAALFCVLLDGCAGPISDPAGRHVYDAWVANHASPNLTGNAMPEDVFQMKTVKDYEYGNYVRALRRSTSWGEFGSDSVKIILDSLVAVTGGTETKAALGAASAGVTGATTSIKKNVLFDQSITTFINKMDALRLNKWNQILCKMGRSSDPDCKTTLAYTAAEAFDDLEEYGRLGTLDAALRDVDAKTSAEKAKVQKNNDKAKGIPSLSSGL
jgi:hypothetical protein